jgi:hypothetical protein
MKKIKYAGVYRGPSYGNPWCPSFEGFTSLPQAEERFTERQETSGRYPLDSTNLSVDGSGEITGMSEDGAVWPATSPEDTIELYEVLTGDDGVQRIGHEPFMRLSAGPRGGVKRENY